MANRILPFVVSHANTDTTRQRDIDKALYQLEPDAAPLYVLTNQANRKQASIDMKFQWFEESEAALWGQQNTTTAFTTGDTDILVVDGTIFAAGDVVAVPAAVTATDEELLLVTAVATNTITVTRGYASTTATTLAAGSALRIVGTAAVEDSGVGAVVAPAPVAKTSYCQFFRDPVKLSEIADATELYAIPNRRRHDQANVLIRHRSKIEAAGLWGKGVEALSTSGGRWATQGFKPTIAAGTNITNMGGTFTFSDMLTFGETGFRYGEKRKLCMAGPAVLSAFDFFAASKLQVKTEENVLGVNIQKMVCNHGTYLLANNFRMEAGISGKNGYEDEMYLINLPSIKFRYLAGNGKNLNTRLLEDVVKDGTAGYVDEYRSVVGWQIMEEKKHSLAHNITSYA